MKNLFAVLVSLLLSLASFAGEPVVNRISAIAPCHITVGSSGSLIFQVTGSNIQDLTKEDFELSLEGYKESDFSYETSYAGDVSQGFYNIRIYNTDSFSPFKTVECTLSYGDISGASQIYMYVPPTSLELYRDGNLITDNNILIYNDEPVTLTYKVLSNHDSENLLSAYQGINIHDGKIYLVGSPTGWKSPDKENSKFYQDWALYDAYATGLYYNQFYLTRNGNTGLQFRFYRALTGWDGGDSLGAQEEDEPIDYPWDGQDDFYGHLVPGKGSFSFPYFTEGLVSMLYDGSRGFIMAYGDTNFGHDDNIFSEETRPCKVDISVDYETRSITITPITTGSCFFHVTHGHAENTLGSEFNNYYKIIVESAGVEDINFSEDSPKISVEDRSISIAECGNLSVNVFTTDGKKIFSSFGEVSVSVIPGLYIVNVGSMVKKVLVR